MLLALIVGLPGRVGAARRLAVPAAGFIHIAVADLVPRPHRRLAVASQTLLILAGIGTIAGFRFGY